MKNAGAASGRNIKLEIEYDGTNFCGWQVQKIRKSKKSIQETIETAFQKVLNEKIHLIASGRTDSGVHAKAQTANFHCKSTIEAKRLRAAVNAFLPPDIVVNRAEDVPMDFHSRFDAKSKVYRYIILNQARRSALLRNYVCFCRYRLDAALIRQEAESIIGRHDFRAFCAGGSGVKDTVRTIKNITIKSAGLPLIVYCKLIVIDIEANGFLYNMARNIAGTLIEIGRGRFPKGSLKEILSSRDRSRAGPTAAASGLYLLKVNY